MGGGGEGESGGGTCRLCPKSRARRMRTSPSGVYPAGGLWWRFACSFDFRHSVRLPFVPAFAFLGGGGRGGGGIIRVL